MAQRLMVTRHATARIAGRFRNNHPTTRRVAFYHASQRLCDVTSPSSSSSSSPKVDELFQKIIYLDMVEVHLLTELINERLGIQMTAADRANLARDGGGGAAAAAAGAAEKEELTEEKTAFDLKLVSFDAKAKIKVIKEVRAIGGFGLKEAKELVEGAPKTVKKGIKMEEAEELKKKLEEVGATVEIA